MTSFPPNRSRSRARHLALASVALLATLLGVFGPAIGPAVGSSIASVAYAAVLSPQSANAPWFRPGYTYDANFPDPSVIYDAARDRYVAFATTTSGVNLPVMTSSDLVTWTARTDHSVQSTTGAFNDGLPQPAPADVTWSTGDPRFPHPIWAPGVVKLGSRWVVFYALQVDGSGRHCIAYATSNVPEGPYLDPRSFVCASDPMGSIDPAPFTDPATGVTYLVWKDQGVPNVHGQRSWARPIALLNSTTVGWAAGSAPTMLFESSGGWEHYSAENPSLVRMDDGGLGLFWSGGEWDTPGYSVGFARCSELSPSTTPVCWRTSDGPIMNRRQGEVGLGGSAAFRGRGGQLYLADHYWAEGLPTNYTSNQRRMVVDRVDELGGRLVMSHEPGPSSASTASGYVSRAPVRVLDTRDATGTTATRRTEANEVFVVDVSGATTSAALAVTVNLTIADPAAAGFATAFECGEPPVASNVNFTAGAIVPDLATIRLNDRRHFCVLTSTASHVIVDVQGEWTSAAPEGFTAVAPHRLVDTRSSGQRLAPGGRIEIPVAGRAGVPAGASAAFVALTSDRSSAAGYLTAWSCDGPAPVVSNVNHGAGVPSTNAAMVRLSSSGTLCVSSLVASDVIVDVFGATAPAGERLTVSRPVRMVDTRDRGAMVGATETLRVPVTYAGRSAASLVITAVDPTGPSWVAVFACDAAPARGAETSVLNVRAGETRAAHVIVPVDDSGAVCVRPLAAMHLVVDRSGALS